MIVVEWVETSYKLEGGLVVQVLRGDNEGIQSVALKTGLSVVSLTSDQWLVLRDFMRTGHSMGGALYTEVKANGQDSGGSAGS